MRNFNGESVMPSNTVILFLAILFTAAPVVSGCASSVESEPEPEPVERLDPLPGADVEAEDEAESVDPADWVLLAAADAPGADERLVHAFVCESAPGVELVYGWIVAGPMDGSERAFLGARMGESRLGAWVDWVTASVSTDDGLEFGYLDVPGAERCRTWVANGVWLVPGPTDFVTW